MLARPLPGAASDLDVLDRVATGTGTLRLPDRFAVAQTDALVVVHRGSVVHERYPHGAEPHAPHLHASAAESCLGLVAAVPAHQGLLDRSARTSRYVPELAGGPPPRRVVTAAAPRPDAGAVTPVASAPGRVSTIAVPPARPETPGASPPGSAARGRPWR